MTASSFQAPPLTIEIVQGDIAAQAADAIVNAANTALWMGAGVAGAIKFRGGDEIEAEAMAQGPIQPGESVLTAAGRLAARHVIHAAVMGEDLQTSGAVIDRATRSVLALADEHGFHSVALPALGTGVGGFSVEECARIMIAAVCGFAPAARTVRSVRFVLLSRASHETFAAAARGLFGHEGA